MNKKRIKTMIAIITLVIKTLKKKRVFKIDSFYNSDAIKTQYNKESYGPGGYKTNFKTTLLKKRRKHYAQG